MSIRKTVRTHLLGAGMGGLPSEEIGPLTAAQQATALANAIHIRSKESDPEEIRLAFQDERAPKKRHLSRGAAAEARAFPPGRSHPLLPLKGSWRRLSRELFGPTSPAQRVRDAHAARAGADERAKLEEVQGAFQETAGWIANRFLQAHRDPVAEVPLHPETPPEQRTRICHALQETFEGLESPSPEVVSAARHLLPQVHQALADAVLNLAQEAMQEPISDIRRLPKEESRLRSDAMAGIFPEAWTQSPHSFQAVSQEGDGEEGLAPCFVMLQGCPFNLEDPNFKNKQGPAIEDANGKPTGEHLVHRNANDEILSWFGANAAVVPILEPNRKGGHEGAPSARLYEHLCQENPEGMKGRLHAEAMNPQGNLVILVRSGKGQEPLWNDSCQPGSEEEKRLLKEPGALVAIAPEDVRANPRPGLPEFVRCIPSLLHRTESKEEDPENEPHPRLSTWSPRPEIGKPFPKEAPDGSLRGRDTGLLANAHSAAIAAAAALGGHRPVSLHTGRTGSGALLIPLDGYAPKLSVPAHAALAMLAMAGHHALLSFGAPPFQDRIMPPPEVAPDGSTVWDRIAKRLPDHFRMCHMHLLDGESADDPEATARWATRSWLHGRHPVPDSVYPGKALPWGPSEESQTWVEQRFHNRLSRMEMPLKGPSQPLRVLLLVPERDDASLDLALQRASLAAASSRRPVQILVPDSDASGLREKAAERLSELELPQGHGTGGATVGIQGEARVDLAVLAPLDPSSPEDAVLWHALAKQVSQKSVPVVPLSKECIHPSLAAQLGNEPVSVLYGGSGQVRDILGAHAESLPKRADIPSETAEILHMQERSEPAAGVIVLDPLGIPGYDPDSSKEGFPMEGITPVAPWIRFPQAPDAEEALSIDLSDLSSQPRRTTQQDRTTLGVAMERAGLSL